ncbi:MAG: hypothetical protein ACLRS8_12900 [Parabacteroides merdae]
MKSAQTDEMPESESKTVTPDLYDESDRITVSQLKELIYCVDSLIGDSEIYVDASMLIMS